MEEYFDVLDEEGMASGITKPKSEVHTKGYWHRTVHIWIINDNNEYEIVQGDTIEIPADTEFAFKGKMKMIEVMNPPFDINTHIDLRKNKI